MNATMFLAGCILIFLAVCQVTRTLAAHWRYEKERAKYLENRRKN